MRGKFGLRKEVGSRPGHQVGFRTISTLHELHLTELEKMESLENMELTVLRVGKVCFGLYTIVRYNMRCLLACAAFW